MNETYHCQSCNKIITITNRINHENTEFHKNNSSYKTCLRCNLKLNKENFYIEKGKLKSCCKDYLEFAKQPLREGHVFKNSIMIIHSIHSFFIIK
jgi:hypothetical protein